MINEKRVPCLHKFRKQCLEPSSIGFFASGLLRGFSKLRYWWVSERITVCSLWPKRCFDHGTLLYSGVYGKSGFSQHIFSDTGFLERSQESRVLVAGCCWLTLWSQAGQVTSLGLSSLIQKMCLCGQDGARRWWRGGTRLDHINLKIPFRRTSLSSGRSPSSLVYKLAHDSVCWPTGSNGPSTLNAPGFDCDAFSVIPKTTPASLQFY